MAEIVREEVSPAALIERVQWLADHAESEAVRLQALTWLADRGWGKAPLQVIIRRGNPYARRVKDLTEAQLLALAALDEQLDGDSDEADERDADAQPN